jgi:hypothetical protein
MGKLADTVRWLFTHQAALTIGVLTSLLTLAVGKLGLDLDGPAIAAAIVAQLVVAFGTSTAVYSKATATTLTEAAYTAGRAEPVPLPGEVVVVPEEVKP